MFIGAEKQRFANVSFGSHFTHSVKAVGIWCQSARVAVPTVGTAQPGLQLQHMLSTESE